jgi:hypothetical protein
MAVDEIVEVSDANKQLDTYNRASGMVKRKSYSPSPGTAWAIVGCVVGDAAVPGDIPAIVTLIEALAEVTSVVGDQVFGQMPTTILAADHEAWLLVSGALSGQRGFGGDTFAYSERRTERVKLPLDKKWAVLALVLPAELDQAGIATLEAAIEGVAGVTTCEHLIDGLVPANATGVSLTTEIRMRIDPIPV